MDSQHKYWSVVINDLSIKRSKDNPLAYNFTLTCTSYEDNIKKLKSIPDFVTKINELCQMLRKPLGTLESWLSSYREAIDILATIEDCLNNLESAINSYSDIASGFLLTTADYVQDAELLVDGIQDRLEYPGRVILNSELTLFTSAIELNNAVNELNTYFINFDENLIYQELIERADTTAKEIKEAWLVYSDDMKTVSEQTLTTIKRSSNQNGIAAIPGNSKTSDTVIPIYGYSTKIVKDSDTWDALSLECYGTTEYTEMLAVYNLTSGITLEAGNKIKIPIVNQEKASNLNNLIYAEPSKLDNYGIDIKVDENGDFAIDKNDFITVDGMNNLSQAINFRLSSTINSRIRLNVYGIKSTIGGIAEASSYVISSIEQTLLEDPRIQSVDTIEFQGEGDNLLVHVIYTDINGEQQNYGGRI